MALQMVTSKMFPLLKVRVTVIPNFVQEKSLKLIEQQLVLSVPLLLDREAKRRFSAQANRPVRMEMGKTRMCLFPEEWFEFFYKKTGVSGFYTFMVTFGTYLVSKEWYVLEHNYYGGISMAILCYLTVTRIGPQTAKMLDQEIDEYEKMWTGARKQKTATYNSMVNYEKKLQDQSGAQLVLMAAKRENIHLQLEANYRMRLNEVYQKVKNILDYQVALASSHTKIAQKHMTKWVVDKVMKAFTPQFEAEYFNLCLTQLSELAKKSNK